jgi:hypothetical protein
MIIYQITSGPIQPAYWPVTVSGDLCGNQTPLSPNATTSRSASAFCTAITSPGVIVSFKTLYATDNCGSPVKTNLSNFLPTQVTSQISSQCWPQYHSTDGGTQVNFANFNSTVLAHAYKWQRQCNGGSMDFGQLNICSTFYDDFQPWLAADRRNESSDSLEGLCFVRVLG